MTESAIRDPQSALPAVTCLCPTYGRFARLREALACFLAQDYPNKHLLILNDAPVPIRVEEGTGPLGRSGSCPPMPVTIQNVPDGHCPNLGHKRQALLELAETPLVAHWDDDDLYLPWHLSRSVAALLARDTGCVKARGAWYLTGPREALQFKGARHNVFEGSMVFRRQEALDLGGYPPKHSGQAKALLTAFRKAGRLHKIGDRHITDDKGPNLPSYVYRWGQNVGHISSIGNKPDAAERFRQVNQDFGNGEPLTPGDLEPYWSLIPSAASASQSSIGAKGARARRDPADSPAVPEEAPA